MFLSAGTYRLGAFSIANTSDSYEFGVPSGQVDWAPNVTFGANHFSTGASLVFPTGSNGAGFDVGAFGPNMILAVPEPTTWALMGLGAVLAAGGTWQYRRRRAKLLEQNTEPDLAEESAC